MWPHSHKDMLPPRMPAPETIQNVPVTGLLYRACGYILNGAKQSTHAGGVDT